MYTLSRAVSLRELLLGQAPMILASLLIAEFFFKFHSFILEAAGFLVVWYLIDLIVDIVARRNSRKS
ncbi:MAG: hypothetical protein AB7H86_19110 [Blastocatellales bacterium]